MAKRKKESLTITAEERLKEALVPENKQPYQIPSNWCWARLSSLALIIMGQSPTGDSISTDNAYIPLIGGAADMGDLFPNTIRFTTKPTKVSTKNDLIICIRATLGKPIYSDGIYCLGRGVAGIRPFIGERNFYLYFFKTFENYLFDNATGSTFLQVTNTVLQKMPVPLPPIAEQQRIVDRIESMFSKLDEAEEKLQSVIDSFETRKATILHKAFTGELTKKWREKNNISLSSWEDCSIDEICKSLRYGTAKKSEKSGKVAVIRMGNLQQGEIDWTDLVYSDDDDDIAKYSLVPGDVLFNRTNSAALVGKTSIYRGEQPAIYAGYFIKLDYDRTRILGDYLNYQLNTLEAKEYCNSVKTDGVNQSNINAKKIGAYKLNVAKLEEQREIIRLLDNYMAKEKQSRELVKIVLQQIELIKQSILSKAFHGELGTNNPADEEAKELIKKILM